MYTYAARLAAMSPNKTEYTTVMQDHLNALLASLNALELAEEDAYIVARPVKVETDAMDVDEPQSKRPRNTDTESVGHAKVIGKNELRREIVVAEGRLQIAKNRSSEGVTGIASQLDAQALVKVALTSGLIDGAATVAGVNQVALDPIVESIVAMCMRVTMAERTNRSIDKRDLDMITRFFDANQRFALANGDGESERAWKLLLQFLHEHKEANLHTLAVDRILGLDWRMQLAPWMVGMFDGNPEDLLRLYLKYHRVEDAAHYAKRVLLAFKQVRPSLLTNLIEQDEIEWNIWKVASVSLVGSAHVLVEPDAWTRSFDA